MKTAWMHFQDAIKQYTNKQHNHFVSKTQFPADDKSKSVLGYMKSTHDEIINKIKTAQAADKLYSPVQTETTMYHDRNKQYPWYYITDINSKNKCKRSKKTYLFINSYIYILYLS